MPRHRPRQQGARAAAADEIVILLDAALERSERPRAQQQALSPLDQPVRRLCRRRRRCHGRPRLIRHGRKRTKRRSTRTRRASRCRPWQRGRGWSRQRGRGWPRQRSRARTRRAAAELPPAELRLVHLLVKVGDHLWFKNRPERSGGRPEGNEAQLGWRQFGSSAGVGAGSRQPRRHRRRLGPSSTEARFAAEKRQARGHTQRRETSVRAHLVVRRQQLLRLKQLRVLAIELGGPAVQRQIKAVRVGAQTFTSAPSRREETSGVRTSARRRSGSA